MEEYFEEQQLEGKSQDMMSSKIKCLPLPGMHNSIDIYNDVTDFKNSVFCFVFYRSILAVSRSVRLVDFEMWSLGSFPVGDVGERNRGICVDICQEQNRCSEISRVQFGGC